MFDDDDANLTLIAGFEDVDDSHDLGTASWIGISFHEEI